MGNCISKINKDHFFFFFFVEELMKNEILFSKGIARLVLESGTMVGTYMGAHYLLRFSEIMTLASLQTVVWWGVL